MLCFSFHGEVRYVIYAVITPANYFMPSPWPEEYVGYTNCKLAFSM